MYQLYQKIKTNIGWIILTIIFGIIYLILEFYRDVDIINTFSK